jgi:predicted nucleic acid-binding protein
MIVIDASVAVKWLVPEPGDAQARTYLHGNERMVAPSIVRVEVANAVIRLFREKRLPENVARTACGLWDTLLADHVLHLIPNEELYPAALALAFQVGHSLPDCLYLAAGKSSGFKIVTADEPMYKRGLKIYSRLEFLDGSVSH